MQRPWVFNPEGFCLPLDLAHVYNYRNCDLMEFSVWDHVESSALLIKCLNPSQIEWINSECFLRKTPPPPSLKVTEWSQQQIYGWRQGTTQAFSSWSAKTSSPLWADNNDLHGGRLKLADASVKNGALLETEVKVSHRQLIEHSRRPETEAWTELRFLISSKRWCNSGLESGLSATYLIFPYKAKKSNRALASKSIKTDGGLLIRD